MHAELTTSRQSLEEIDKLTGGVQEKIEDGRKKVKDITENITALKEKHTALTEKRKEMWLEVRGYKSSHSCSG
jgi:structural maintenance of chromosome 3 (chondroitin sulfate proteoglycan 6)